MNDVALGTYYETRAVRTDECSTGVEIERYTSLGAAIVGSLALWPEDDRSDVMVYAITEGNVDLLATIRHEYHDDPSIATVCAFKTTGRPDVDVCEYRCQYIEIYDRIHTNITKL